MKLPPLITINGTLLNLSQSLTLIAAANEFYESLTPESIAELGPIGESYKQQIRSILGLVAAGEYKSSAT